jgi:hypothetical protein
MKYLLWLRSAPPVVPDPRDMSSVPPNVVVPPRIPPAVAAPSVPINAVPPNVP